MKQYNRHASMQNTRRELRTEEEGAYVQERLDARETDRLMVQYYMDNYSSAELLDMIGYGSDDEKALCEAYERKEAEEQERYRKENEDKLWAFYREHLENNPDADGYDWQWFSDWHKDVYGFRPHYLYR